MTNSPGPILEQVLEFRYLPNAAFIDHRGNFAASTSTHMGLSEWNVGDNRIDLFSKDKLSTAFIGFRNAGFVLKRALAADLFPEQASKFVKFVLLQKPFITPMVIERIGVRFRMATPVNMQFSNFVERFKEKATQIAPDYADIFGAELYDIAIPLKFQKSDGYLNTNSGPMDKEQLSKLFDVEEEEILPEVSLYVDVDYFIKPVDSLSVREIVTLIKKFSEENWNLLERVPAYMLG